jgi:FkbM family methyltransferase
MIKRTLPDGNIYYLPKNKRFRPNLIESEISEIYNPKDSHNYEKFYSIKKGMTVLDIGAYTGLFSLKASKLVGTKGKVIALEPFPKAFEILKINLKKNNCKNVIPLNIGIGSQICKRKMITGGWYIGSWVLNVKKNNTLLEKCFFLVETFIRISFSLIKGRKIIDVNLINIDTLLNYLNINRLDYIKMDIEGFETEAISGFSKILDNNIIIIETHNNLERVLYYLTKKGVSLKDIKISRITQKRSIIHLKISNGT